MAPTRMTLCDYEAWIVVDGQEVEHYGIEVDDTSKEVTCWVASTEGKNFTIFARKSHCKFDCVFHAYVDGSPAGGGYLLQPALQSRSRSGILLGPTSMRPYQFGRLEVSDDDSLLYNSSASKDIGEIKVTIRRASNLQPPKSAGYSTLPISEKVHERSKKAVAHRVQFGEETKLQVAMTTQSATYHETLATFRVLYRSLDMLKANGIAPHEPTKAPRPERRSQSHSLAGPSSGKRKQLGVKEEQSDEELDQDEIEARRKEAELEAQLEALRKARQARAQENPAKKKVKREQKPVFMPGEVIDLTL